MFTVAALAVVCSMADAAPASTTSGAVSPATDASMPNPQFGNVTTCTTDMSTEFGCSEIAGADRVAFTRWDADPNRPILWTGNADGTNLRAVGDQVAWFPDWSPDRTTILFDFTDDNGDEQIATIRPDGTRFEQLTDGPGYSEAADYSPDGTTIVFDRSPVHDEDDPTFTTSLWTMGVDGGDAHQVVLGDGGGFDYEPEFSPDGGRIVFARYDAESDTSAAFVAQADGTAVTQLTPFVHFTEHPRWSSDGAMIIYNIEDQRNLRDPINGIWVVASSGGTPSQLLQSSASLHGFKPDYSPDGSRILFGCFSSATGTDDLCVMNADGTDAHVIVETAGTFENHPIWN